MSNMKYSNMVLMSKHTLTPIQIKKLNEMFYELSSGLTYDEFLEIAKVLKKAVDRMMEQQGMEE